MKKIILVLSMSMSALVMAQQSPLDQLADKVRQDAARQGQINQEREAKFVRERNNQQELLRQARAELAEQRRISDQLQTEFDANEQKLVEQETVLDERMGNLGELFGVVRQVSGDLQSIFDDSLTSAQFPNRGEFFGDLAQRRELPTGRELGRMWSEMVREIAEQGKVVTFNATVVEEGVPVSNESVTRVGVFNAVLDNKFLTWNSGSQELLLLPRQPAGRYQGMADDLTSAAPGEVVPMAVDFTRGAILSQVVQAPTLPEKIRQGKTVGYVIIAIGLFGLLFSLYKGIMLLLQGTAINGQLKKSEADKNNALGRVMSVYSDAPDTDIETLELKLDEAILRETAPIESGLSFIKVLYVVAPLLGLLGTVVGMIDTFQQITLFGTGDPRMMAGGISTALVTTVLGLVVAIPLTILHSLLQSKARTLIQVLEEQAAGIIARMAERQNAGA